MKLQVRSVLSGIANLVAILIVISVAVQNLPDAAPKVLAPSLTTVMTEQELVVQLPTTADRARHDLRHKGKSAVECIPLYPTLAPTKGKGGRGGRVPPPPIMGEEETTTTSKSGNTGKGSSSAAPVSLDEKIHLTNTLLH